MAHPARSAHIGPATRIGAFAAAVLSAAATLTGCSTADSASEPAGAAPAERPLLTKAEANTTVDAYQKLNNQANAKRSASLMAKAEGGAVLAMDQAYFTQIPALDKSDVADNIAPFVYVNRTFYIPPASSKANWFLVRTQGAHLTHGKPGKLWSKDIRFLVFKRSGDGWRMVVARDFEGSEVAKVPHIALDKAGLMKVADPDTKIGKTAPSQLPELVTDLWVTGGRNTPLANTSARRIGRSWYTERENNLDGHAWVDFKKTAPAPGTSSPRRPLTAARSCCPTALSMRPSSPRTCSPTSTSATQTSRSSSTTRTRRCTRSSATTHRLSSDSSPQPASLPSIPSAPR